MPRLTDVFAAILSDLAAARKMADEQTIRIAEEYRKDPLLAAMTVPRIRIPEVTVDLPILIEGCEFTPTPEDAEDAAGDRSLDANNPGGASAAGRVPEKASPESFARIAGGVLERARAEQGRAQRPGVPTLEVLVSAEDIKNRGEGAPITRLHLILREEGLEMVAPAEPGAEGSRDVGGGRGFRLVPE